MQKRNTINKAQKKNKCQPTQGKESGKGNLVKEKMEF